MQIIFIQILLNLKLFQNYLIWKARVVFFLGLREYCASKILGRVQVLLFSPTEFI